MVYSRLRLSLSTCLYLASSSRSSSSSARRSSSWATCQPQQGSSKGSQKLARLQKLLIQCPLPTCWSVTGFGSSPSRIDRNTSRLEMHSPLHMTQGCWIGKTRLKCRGRMQSRLCRTAGAHHFFNALSAPLSLLHDFEGLFAPLLVHLGPSNLLQQVQPLLVLHCCHVHDLHQRHLVAVHVIVYMLLVLKGPCCKLHFLLLCLMTICECSHNIPTSIHVAQNKAMQAAVETTESNDHAFADQNSSLLLDIVQTEAITAKKGCVAHLALLHNIVRICSGKSCCLKQIHHLCLSAAHIKQSGTQVCAN